jgi:hypothetical protein
VRSPTKRRLVTAVALICQIFAGLAVHVAPANANERPPLPAKHLQTIRDAQVVRGAQKAPCPEHKAAQTESSVKAADTAKADAVKPDCCKDGTCKCPAATPAAVESRAVAAPAACPAPRADGICEAPPSRLRPSVFFRPPI